MRLYYLAHPLHPQGDETWNGNILSAKIYLEALLQAEIPVDAPWLALTYLEGAVPEEDILKICCESVRRHDGLIHVGPRVAPGMQREEAAMAPFGRIYDLTKRPPAEVVSFMRIVTRRDA